MNNAPNLAATVAWLGFIVAFILGAISARTQFCTLGAVSDIVNMSDFTRMRMWVLAMAIAILGAQGLYAAMPRNANTTTDFRLPPPMRTSVRLPQPLASVMPMPNINPPPTYESQVMFGRV